MIIREFKNSDAEQVSAFIKECFQKLDLGKHTIEGIRLQIEGNSPESLINRSKSIKYYVALDGENIAGICGYDNVKVHTLFVDIHYHKKGIGRHLLLKVLNEAKKDGLSSISTWSTIYAEDFYKKFGFKRIGEISIPEDTKDIVLVEMTKQLIDVPCK